MALLQHRIKNTTVEYFNTKYCNLQAYSVKMEFGLNILRFIVISLSIVSFT